ncbi:MAG: nitroreductase family protein [archaeon]
MDALTAIKSRRSIRSFRSDRVPIKTIYKLIDAARWAPSAGNLQSWEFILVEDATAKKQLAAASLSQEFISTAPVVIVACADTERSAVKYGSRGKYFYSIVDVSAAIENMMIAATSLGLGTCWVGSFNNNIVRDVLGLPEGIAPVAIIPVGYPADDGVRTARTSLGNILHFEKFGKFQTIRTGDSDESPPPKATKSKDSRGPGLLDIFR